MFVNDEATSVIKGKGPRPPYAAPEVIDGYGASAKSDQFALAAVTYEWMFGRPIPHAGDREIEVRSMPGVDRAALSKAYTRALSPDPDDRFESCVAFCNALSGAVVPELPLLADFIPESELTGVPLKPGDSASDKDDSDSDIVLGVPAPSVDDVKIVAEESIMTAGQPDLDAIDPRILASTPAPVPSWNPAAASTPRSMEPQRFGPIALFLAVVVGAVSGFAAGYMARPRALQSSAPQQIAVAPATAAPVKGASGASGATGKAPEAPAPMAPPAPEAPKAPKSVPEAPKAVGRLLVRSTPSGASVSVDGVAKGVTPLALRDLDVGTWTVTLARRGYISETRRVVITKARPARTLEVRLSSEPVAAAPRPSTPASIGRPASSTGTLSVDSRPSGATVTIDGKARGTTPFTINDLAPGEYHIVMTMPGYRNFATTVRVVAGESARAAASLTALEKQ